ncbi:MAG: DinB family protein [Gemmatimonadetes bacterium]|nr:DinB family protein [Gemmatimonadota bacterium]
MTAPSPEIRLLLRFLDEAFDRQAWHGPTLRGALRRVSAQQAAWRPANGRHNIWEIALHASYWKYAVRRRLRGDPKGSFPRPGSNWPRLPDPLDEATWRQDVRLLVQQHQELRDTIANFPAHRLDEKSRGSRFPNLTLMYGAAAHDLYHAGQIQLLKRLRQETSLT